MGTVLSHPAAEERALGSQCTALLPQDAAAVLCPRCRRAGFGKSLSLRAERGVYRLTTLSDEEGLWNFKGRKCLFPAHNLFMCFLEKR